MEFLLIVFVITILTLVFGDKYKDKDYEDILYKSKKDKGKYQKPSDVNNVDNTNRLFEDFNAKTKAKYQESSDVNTIEQEKDLLKLKGNKYEKYIGKQFEKKGDLVIYNGFIRGYDDKGVDIIAISPTMKIINLVQCKNWTNLKMELSHIESIYNKLHYYDMDFYTLYDSKIINYMNIKKTPEEVRQIIKDSKTYDLRKTLYIASEKVIDLDIGKYLYMIKPNIFKYQDMKIVFIHNAEL